VHRSPFIRRARSGAAVRALRRRYAMVGVDDRPTVVLEHVALYRSDGARRYLGELRRALPTCAEPGWTRPATGIAGDESLLLGLREYVDHAQTPKFTVVLVARVGRVLVVVADTGWETGSGHADLVRAIGAAAVRRAAVLNVG
jgi:hypothetical protein